VGLNGKRGFRTLLRCTPFPVPLKIHKMPATSTPTLLRQNVSLLPYNTFGLPARAEWFAACTSVDELREAIAAGIAPVLVLGGGSNLLLTQAVVPGLVVHNAIGAIEVVSEEENYVWVKAGGGVNWHEFVLHCVEANYGGVENLSLIPGTVGAAPVQNIGAYGVELKDTMTELEAVELATGELRRFTAADCQFGYRDSFFKREGKGRFCITSVTFRLTRREHRIHVTYGDLRRTLDRFGIEGEPAIADVSRAVIEIRSGKLPDPAVIGNCGSFFKNPEVDRDVLERVRATHPHVVHFDLPDGRVKIPAGWLIEQCGWKGRRLGNAGCYEKQALVLVNLGGATGEEVLALAKAIIESVETTFGIRLEPEVNIL
jgi:UDP-N-acetylmuramate dehydrogenase